MLVSAFASLLVFTFKSASTSKSLQRNPSTHVPTMPLFNNHTTWKDYLTFLSDETLIRFTDVVKCGNRNFSFFRFARGVTPSFAMQNGELKTEHLDIAAFPGCKDKYNWFKMRNFVHKTPAPSDPSPGQSRIVSSYQTVRPIRGSHRIPVEPKVTSP
ncbi:hypothetical protein BCR37DRAFT_411821 [Protomyces lactucae-debilis]|uniref:Uncharacterized protein n=1 Tax=Protomyces lactucae-debilis TaxID=2754530 RepID=A0A1Y2FSZ4_PROLT|nr:uncharacterized protein BCR37DRAFT_411821 [Protomyces lactucae-debilis]ORY87059.1 hypothetical protein BCR37DRAFT_411821 [Protomyces lactucae-debilis]